MDMDEVKMLAVELRWIKQGVRDAIHIKMELLSLNKDEAVTTFPLFETIC